MSRRTSYSWLAAACVVFVALGQWIVRPAGSSSIRRTQRVSRDRLEWPRHGVFRQDRDGPGRVDVAGANDRRGAGVALNPSTWCSATPTDVRPTWVPSAP